MVVEHGKNTKLGKAKEKELFHPMFKTSYKIFKIADLVKLDGNPTIKSSVFKNIQENYDSEVLFPIIVTEDDNGVMEIQDGHTRVAAFHAAGRKYIHGYLKKIESSSKAGKAKGFLKLNNALSTSKKTSIDIFEMELRALDPKSLRIKKCLDAHGIVIDKERKPYHTAAIMSIKRIDANMGGISTLDMIFKITEAAWSSSYKSLQQSILLALGALIEYCNKDILLTAQGRTINLDHLIMRLKKHTAYEMLDLIAFEELKAKCNTDTAGLNVMKRLYNNNLPKAEQI